MTRRVSGEIRKVIAPNGGEWTWYLRPDGRYQVTSAEVSTYGFAMTARELAHSCSETMQAVWADVRQTIPR